MVNDGAIDPAAATEVAAIEARARRIDTPCGEGTMAWRIWGEDDGRPPIVLAHGAQGAWSHWIRNVEVLARRHRVITMDLPGQGDSAMPATPDHPGMSTAIARGMSEIIGPDRQADFAGFSYGGVVLAHCAAFHPNLARRLILIGCGGLSTPLGAIDIRRAAGLRGAERRAVLTSNLLGLMLHHAETVDDLALHLLVTNARATRLADAALVQPDRLARILPEVRCRVDAIWGEFDRPHPDPALQEAVIRRTHPECDFRVIADSGHWAMYERAQAFNAALLDLLAKWS